MCKYIKKIRFSLLTVLSFIVIPAFPASANSANACFNSQTTYYSAATKLEVQLSPTPLPDTAYAGNFMYPNAVQVFADTYQVMLQTSDQLSVVQDWYKKEFSDSNFQVTSVMNTTINDSQSSVMAGTNGQQEGRISMQRLPGSPMTSITITKVNNNQTMKSY